MSRLSPAIVLVKNILCSVPRTDFSDAMIEAGAQLILQLEGVITPLILRREGIEHYHVVSGYLEYYAALKAKEINLRQGETINAYIIDPDNEATIIQQIDLFKNTHIMTKNTPQTNDINSTVLEIMNNQLQSLSRIAQSMTESLSVINNEISALKISLANITSITSPPVTEVPEEKPVAEKAPKKPKAPAKAAKSTNKVAKKDSEKKTVVAKKGTVAKKSEPVKENKSVETPEIAPQPTTSIQWLAQLNALPDKELISKLAALKVKGEVINAVLKARPLQTVAEIQKIKGLGAKTVEKIEKSMK